MITGPDGTPYAEGMFFLTLNFPQNYPFGPPVVKFKTKIFHPSVDSNGLICQRFLKEDWSPAIGVAKILENLQLMLQNPDPDHPLNQEVAKLLAENPEEFTRQATQFTADHAK